MPPPGQELSDQAQKRGEQERLGQTAIGSGCPYGGNLGWGEIAGDDQDRRGHPQPAKFARELHAVETEMMEVGQDQVRSQPLRPPQRFPTVGAAVDPRPEMSLQYFLVNRFPGINARW